MLRMRTNSFCFAFFKKFRIWSINLEQYLVNSEQGRIQEFVQGGGLKFLYFQGGSTPVGAWKPPEINRFHWSRGGLAQIAPLNTPLTLYTVHFLLHTVHCTLYTVHCLLYRYNIYPFNYIPINLSIYPSNYNLHSYLSINLTF